MDKGQQIKGLIPAVYNVRFDQTAGSCMNEACKYGKCICMDSEQAGLLQGILVKEDFIGMDIRKGNFLFFNLQHGAAQADQKCPQAVQGNERLPDWFVPHRNLVGWEELDRQIGEAVRDGQADFADMLGSVLAVYMINSSRELDERESLLSLCVYASCPQRYLDQLLRAVICYTIGCYKKGDTTKWSEYTQKITELFHKLNILFDNSEKRIEELMEVMDHYFTRLGVKGKGSQIRMAQNVLGECRDRIKNVPNRKLAVCEGEKSKQWYRILKKIFEIMGMPMKGFPELNFVDPKISPSDYDDIIQIMNDVMADQNKTCQVLEKIRDVFYYGRDITDDEVIQELRRISKA